MPWKFMNGSCPLSDSTKSELRQTTKYMSACTLIFVYTVYLSCTCICTVECNHCAWFTSEIHNSPTLEIYLQVRESSKSVSRHPCSCNLLLQGKNNIHLQDAITDNIPSRTYIKDSVCER